MNEEKTIAPFKLSSTYYAWIEEEKKRTGNSIPAIIRALIQKQMDKEGYTH